MLHGLGVGQCPQGSLFHTSFRVDGGSLRWKSILPICKKKRDVSLHIWKASEGSYPYSKYQDCFETAPDYTTIRLSQHQHPGPITSHPPLCFWFTTPPTPLNHPTTPPHDSIFSLPRLPGLLWPNIVDDPRLLRRCSMPSNMFGDSLPLLRHACSDPPSSTFDDPRLMRL